MKDIALSQRYQLWKDHYLGEEKGGPTIGVSGCLLTVLAMFLRFLYGTDVTPDILNIALALAKTAFIDDHYLVWKSIPPLFSRFHDYLYANYSLSAAELGALLESGWCVSLRRGTGDNTHFVYLDRIDGGRVWVIDPWYGEYVRHNTGTFTGVRALRYGKGVSRELLVGLHDEGGGDWMKRVGMQGVCLVHKNVTDRPISLNFEHLANAGIKVYVRLNRGYADGTGTIPPAEMSDAWVENVASTINTGRGVHGWIICNEWNNPGEWKDFPDPSYIVSPGYCIDVYNRIRGKVLAGIRMTPAAIDPFNVVAGEFGQPNDPRVWAEHGYEHADGMEFIAIHAKTQTNNPAECWSKVKFSDWPLQDRYLHLPTVEDQLKWIPDRLKHLPIIITELNPQRKSDGSLGWDAGNSAWIEEACKYLRSLNAIDGMMLYRYDKAGDQSGFGLVGDGVSLARLQREAS